MLSVWLLTSSQLYDAVTLLTALTAIAFTIRESRRNNSVVIKIMKSQFGGEQSINENKSQFFFRHDLIIHNLGIALRDVHVVLSFADFAGHGTLSVPLQPVRSLSDGAEFSKGMIAHFCQKSYTLNEHDKKFLIALKDLRTQNAQLAIYSQGYLAKRWNLGSRSERVRERIHDLLSRHAMTLSRKRKSPDGKRTLVQPFDPPKPILLGRPFLEFVQSIAPGDGETVR